MKYTFTLQKYYDFVRFLFSFLVFLSVAHKKERKKQNKLAKSFHTPMFCLTYFPFELFFLLILRVEEQQASWLVGKYLQNNKISKVKEKVKRGCYYYHLNAHKLFYILLYLSNKFIWLSMCKVVGTYLPMSATPK